MFGLPASIAQFSTLAVRAFHIDVDPAVRIDQLNFRHGGVFETCTGLFPSNSAANA